MTEKNDYVMIALVIEGKDATWRLAIKRQEADDVIERCKRQEADVVMLDGFLVVEAGSPAFPKGYEKTDKSARLLFTGTDLQVIEITELYQDDEE